MACLHGCSNLVAIVQSNATRPNELELVLFLTVLVVVSQCMPVLLNALHDGKACATSSHAMTSLLALAYGAWYTNVICRRLVETCCTKLGS
mmetsp:Transcript_9512/g.21205  ORF Transcript_9512/g.21205 Transcript_9512/m.21205 type:complete len:91 (+) Transcript_9512:1874-2146(+)